ncbi:MAG: FtsQ-type POTRA domain-containing protein [Candidatus Eremiobacteraeota bacterium]|nr:FtsQ-type POTRA domain-containing protein [Candidatus Eremiobacteraeota bacterium]
MKRRRKATLAARIKPFWIFAVLLVGLIAWGGAWLVRSPWFRVTRVGIEVPLASPVSRDAVRASAGISRDTNVWLIDTRAAARRIEAIPYVDGASIHRGQFPKPFVDLAITVRRPSACVRGGDRDVSIDATARVLQAGCPSAALPRIDAGEAAVPAPGGTVADPEVGRLLADAKTLSDANLAVRRIARDRWGGLEAVDVTGITIRFGADDDLAKKAALVEPVRKSVAKRSIRAIDLRAPATPTVEFR